MTFFDIFYLLLLILLSPLWITLAAFNPKIRFIFSKKFFPRYKAESSSFKTRSIWVHGASVGEVDIAIRIINRLKDELDVQFVLTTNTPAGLEIARKNHSGPSMIAPFDFSFLIRKFVRHFGVHGLILVETEIWSNMISYIGKHHPVVVVNGRLSDRHFHRYQKYRLLFRKALSRVRLILAGEKISADRFEKLGIPRDLIQQPGNIKFTLPKAFNDNLMQEIQQVYEIQDGDFIWVNGSIQPEEMGYLTEAWFQLEKKIPGLRMILIPRHPDKLERFEEALKAEFVDYELTTETSHPARKARVHLIARMGVLKTWYRLADSIFVGGSFSQRGGQNMMEAVALKKAVCVGPYAVNFKQEVDLLQAGGGLEVVQNTDELIHFVDSCYSKPEMAIQMGLKGQRVIEENSQAMEKTIRELIKILKV